jgi:hypothetical protein
VKLEEGGNRKRSNTDMDGDGRNERYQEAKATKKPKKGKKAKKEDASIVKEQGDEEQGDGAEEQATSA